MIRLYGWRRSPDDDRDALFRASRPLGAIEVPAQSDGRFRAIAPAPLNQHRSDCVAHGTSTGVQLVCTPDGGPPAPRPSRDWIYSESGVKDGSQDQDNGRYVRSALDALGKLGWPDEVEWPYGSWPTHPGAEVHRMAFDRRGNRVIERHRLDLPGMDLVTEWKAARAAGMCIVGGTLVTQAFEDQDGITPLPAPSAGDGILGGHCTAFPEYDADGPFGLNSWGNWADRGWYHLSWAWVRAMCSDVWGVRLVEAAP